MIPREVKFPTQWEVTIFQDKSINAFALLGGKIGVYTGLLNVTEIQYLLAIIITNEVAYVTC